MHVQTFDTYDELSRAAADMVADQLRVKADPVLGLATGSTPEGMYTELRLMHGSGSLSFKNVITFNLDEYAGILPENPQSYHYYMNQNLFDHVDIPRDAINLPSADIDNALFGCQNYEDKIAELGGIDLQVLGLGLDGHIGFNEPGSAFDSRTRPVELDESTRQANARFFDNIDQVPTQAITMGIGTIMEARKILLLVNGEAKADILRRVLHGEITKQVPASVLQNHPDVTVLTDIKL